MSIQEEKRALREKIRAKRLGIPVKMREHLSEKMLAELSRESFFHTDEYVFLYASMPEEVQLYGLIRFMLDTERKIAIPSIKGKGEMEAVELSSGMDLKQDEFGLLTVAKDKRKIVPPEAIGLVIVPGVAFSEEGHRLGMGGGYYDNFLRDSAPHAYRAALAFDVQLQDKIPTEKHDEKVDYIITESRSIAVKKG
ncbi:MAG: 5-formyltetrahydrofolate cyclo-ligase [Selenomonadaceae bacterium]|nr:5-formyltetrahydrofolate cyclo-ligase [Selenomonadaceae bacterium]